MTKLKVTSTLKVPQSFHPELTKDHEIPTQFNFIENVTYSSDGTAVSHNVDFLDNPLFTEHLIHSLQIKEGSSSKYPYGSPVWRAYIAGWAGRQALRVEGDFVECGVDTGILSSMVCQQTDFNNQDRHFYLLDSFEGMDMSLLTNAEKEKDDQHKTYSFYKEHYASNTDNTLTQLHTKIDQFHNIHIIKGYIPETLTQIKAENIAYLSIDLNAVVPEMATIKTLWDRLSIGAVILLDDYTFMGHDPQREAWNQFATEYGQHILTLWTGQGLIIKI